MAHAHLHAPEKYDTAFLIGVVVNAGFVVVEAAYGIAAGSMALVSDAGHNFSDVVALILAWSAFRLARSRPTERRTYGLRRATVLASLASAVLLFVALGAVVWEALARLVQPTPLDGVTVIVVAAIGVLVNGVTAYMFLAGRRSDLNIKGAFLHMAADAAISLGVVIAGLVILATGWLWIDPVLALAIAVAILASGFGLLRESLDLAMDAVPRHIDLREVHDFLRGLPDVVDVHDLHVWATSTTETALTVHLVVANAPTGNEMLERIARTLEHRFTIRHPTIQIEIADDDAACAGAIAPCPPPLP